MKRHKRFWAIWALALCTALETYEPSLANAPEPVAPSITTTHRRFLSTVARRTLRDAAIGRPQYEPGYIPEGLISLHAEALVRLRQRGFLFASGSGGPGPVALCVRDAAQTAMETLRLTTQVDAPLANEFLVEIEVVGPEVPVAYKGDWTSPEIAEALFEPGIDGIVVRAGTAARRFCPTELFTSDLTMTDALKDQAQQILQDPLQMQFTRLFRFRTDHWYEAGGGGEIVSLVRGMTPVLSEQVSLESVSQAIERIAEYMVYRQLPSGLFSYQYEPGNDLYSESDNLIRQIGSTVALAYHAKRTGKSASRDAANRAIKYHLQGLTKMAGDEGVAFIATADGHNKLGVTALLSIALAEHPDADTYGVTLEQLVNGMLRLQTPDGMFWTAFPPAERIDAQDYYPGEALLAMAIHYARQPSGRILDAFDRAIRFYQPYFRRTQSPAFVSWQVQAFASMAQQGKRKDYADFVFELADWLADRQLNESNCRFPDLRGGIAVYENGRAGVATAAYLEGFADALKLAREVGDESRARRYEKLVREAVRFVLQLQVRPEEAYFMRSERDAVDGIRTSPALNLLRIDHCQHALVGLLKARQVLWPDAG